MFEDLIDILSAGATESTMVARVLRHVQDRPVEPRAEDFYAALKHDPAVVVRLIGDMPIERMIPIDCRFRNGAIEFTTEFRDITLIGRDQFLDDVRDADKVQVLHYRDSQFGTGEGWTCYNCGGEFFNPDSQFIESRNECRVTCPDCGVVDEIPQSSEPPADREYGEGCRG